MYFITRPTASLVSSSSLNQSRSRASPSGHARAQGGGQVFLVHPQPVRARGGVLPKRQLPPERERERARGRESAAAVGPVSGKGRGFPGLRQVALGVGEWSPKQGSICWGRS